MNPSGTSRKERLAAALRENLKRRKARARASLAAVQAPAAKQDDSRSGQKSAAMDE